MHLTNATPFVAGWTLGLDPDGRERVVVVAKATFRMPKRGEASNLGDEQLPLVMADEFSGEPGFSAPLYEADFAPHKPRCDVLINGTGHAPAGKPATQIGVGFRVGQLSKKFAVIGRRHWVKALIGFTSSRPLPFVRLPISYDVAYGGRDVSHPDPAKHRFYALNHAGVGFHVHHTADAVQGKPLPTTEEFGKPVERPTGKYRPMAFGAVARAWQPRAGYAGTYDAKWLEEHFPFPAPDFDARYHQAAPEDQQAEYLRGGEEVVLMNLTPEGRTAFRLPSVSVPLTFYPARGAKEQIQAVCDTLLLEPDQGRFAMAWRGSRPLQRDLFELKEVVVGQPTRAWQRARDSGKPYYASLATLPRRLPSGNDVQDGEDEA